MVKRGLALQDLVGATGAAFDPAAVVQAGKRVTAFVKGSQNWARPVADPSRRPGSVTSHGEVCP
jgi:hypothetical protein